MKKNDDNSRIADDLAMVELEKKLWSDYKTTPNKDHSFIALIDFYLPLVVKIVKQIVIQTAYQTKVNELIGTGVIGLHEAIQRFDSSKECSFRSFAAFRIRGALLDELRRQDPLSRRQRQLTRELHHLEQELTNTNQKAPTLQQLAEKAGISEEETEQLLHGNKHTVSLQNEAGEGLEFIDTIQDLSIFTPSEEADHNSQKELLKLALKKLPEREQQLMYLRHFQELSVKEIAAVFSISVGRVSQMYNETILHLREIITKIDRHQQFKEIK